MKEFLKDNWLTVILCILSYLGGVATARTAAALIKLIVGGGIVGIVLIVLYLLKRRKDRKEIEHVEKD